MHRVLVRERERKISGQHLCLGCIWIERGYRGGHSYPIPAHLSNSADKLRVCCGHVGKLLSTEHVGKTRKRKVISWNIPAIHSRGAGFKLRHCRVTYKLNGDDVGFYSAKLLAQLEGVLVGALGELLRALEILLKPSEANLQKNVKSHGRPHTRE